MWKFLNSRKVAVFLLCLFLGMLLGSALIPSPYTVTPREWQELQRQNGALFWAYSHLSTPFVVKNPLFAAISLALFLSTLVCTIERGRQWWSSRCYELSKEKAFSFAVTETSARTRAALLGEVESLLSSGRWRSSTERSGESVVLSGDKGMSGFWGSMVFHLGLLACFLAAPVTLVTGFKGEMTLVEDEPVLGSAALTSPDGGGRSSALDAARVKVRAVRGEYYQGQFKYDFGGRLSVADGGGEQEMPFAVNHPVSYRGYQFSLNSFGFAPHLVIGTGQGNQVDNYLRVSNAEEENYFTLDKELRAFVLFFPDFVREGGKVGTRSKNPANQVTMVKLFRGEREVFKGLFRPGEEAVWEGRRISVPDYKHWVAFAVTREYGIVCVLIGFVLVVAGLFARFLSNERRIEFELVALPEGTAVKVRGYSRYYPAFLEKEVLQMAGSLK